MFRRRVSQSQAEPDPPPAPQEQDNDTPAQAPAQAPAAGAEGAPLSIAALRSQSRRRTSDTAAGQPLQTQGSTDPPQQSAGGPSRTSSGGGVAAVRTRAGLQPRVASVPETSEQQTPPPPPAAAAAVPAPPAAQAPTAARRAPRAAAAAPAAAPAPAADDGGSPAGFKSYSNPLSSDQAAAPAAGDAQQQQQQQAAAAVAVAAGGQSKPLRQPQSSQATAIPKGTIKYPDRSTWHFEVTPADADTPSAGAAGAAVDQSRVPQYVYNPDTGLLERMGEGQGTDCTARHYLQDWRTGAFLQLQGEGDSGGGCLGCFRRWRRSRWSGGAALGSSGADGDGDDDWLRSLTSFSDAMGHWMALLGLAAQGLCGGLACMALFMTYLLTSRRGGQAFLQYYAPLAQSLNRTYFTLISLSIVAVVARLGYDANARFKPTELRLRVVTAIMLLLYGTAYICNVLLTPLDDRFTYEYNRVPQFWSQDLPRSFQQRVVIWHSLNLIRIICCGLAWVFVCYRASPHTVIAVMMAQQQQQQGQVGQGQGGELEGPALLAAGLMGSGGSLGYGGQPVPATMLAGGSGHGPGVRRPGSLVSADVYGTTSLGVGDAIPPLAGTAAWR